MMLYILLGIILLVILFYVVVIIVAEDYFHFKYKDNSYCQIDDDTSVHYSLLDIFYFVLARACQLRIKYKIMYLKHSYTAHEYKYYDWVILVKDGFFLYRPLELYFSSNDGRAISAYKTQYDAIVQLKKFLVAQEYTHKCKVFMHLDENLFASLKFKARRRFGSEIPS